VGTELRLAQLAHPCPHCQLARGRAWGQSWWLGGDALGRIRADEAPSSLCCDETTHLCETESKQPIRGQGALNKDGPVGQPQAQWPMVAHAICRPPDTATGWQSWRMVQLNRATLSTSPHPNISLSTLIADRATEMSEMLFTATVLCAAQT